MTRDASSLGLQTHSPADTCALGMALGRVLWPGAVVCLEGDLGAGKTCLTQGLGQGLGVDEPIISPTFTLIREYRGRLPLYHVDCYRLSDPEDAWALGLDDYLFGDGVTVVEWADRVRALMPADRLWIRLEYLDGDARRVTLTACGESYQACLSRLPLPPPDLAR